ncbi:MAG: outer membrane beta-barrel protein [Gammaproteobacteria bacterium]|nr:outer membrane beta-barrel protein [Gammaproteobacteria bacterium]
MLKKIFAGCTLLFSCITVAHAAAFYLGPTIFLKANTSNSNSIREASPRFSLGYGGNTTQYYYFGGEIFVDPFSAVVSNHNKTGPTMRDTHSFGISIIPGVRLNESSMVYVRIGGIDSHFTYNNNNDVGLQLGLGLSTTVSMNWDVRGEYNYVTYRSMTDIGAPRSDWYGIGAVYRFE